MKIIDRQVFPLSVLKDCYTVARTDKKVKELLGLPVDIPLPSNQRIYHFCLYEQGIVVAELYQFDDKED